MIISEEQAVIILKQDGVVALPTETVYGLACNAKSKTAIEQVYKIKNRPADNPLICHFSSMDEILKEVITPADFVLALMKILSPGPVSYLLNLKPNSLLRAATAGSNKVVARIPDQENFLRMLSLLDFPLAAPSANTSGKVSPTNASMVEYDLGNKIDGIVDGGNCIIGLESTILDCTNKNKIVILRPGAIGKKEIENLLVQLELNVTVIENIISNEVTPGTKYRHYSPVTPVYKINDIHSHSFSANETLILVLQQLDEHKHFINELIQKGVMILNLGSLTEMEKIASQLFVNLKMLDEQKSVAAFMLPIDWGTSSIGMAIANRLSKVIL